MIASGINAHTLNSSTTAPWRITSAASDMSHPLDLPSVGIVADQHLRADVWAGRRSLSSVRTAPAIRVLLFSAILLLSWFVGVRPSFGQGVQEFLCTQKCWFVDTVVSGNPLNPVPTEESKQCKKTCCESIGMRPGMVGCEPKGPPASSSSRGTSGGASSSGSAGGKPSPNFSSREPGISDRILEAAGDFGSTHPNIGATSDFFYNYLTIVKVNEDCLVNCSGAQLIQMAFLNASVTTLGGA